MFAEVFDAILTMVTGMTLYASPILGALPASNGIAMAPAPGTTGTVYLDRGSSNTLLVVVNAKHQNQMTALDTLSYIHSVLQRTKNYPPGNGWEITNIQTSSAPSYIGSEESGRQHLWGSSLQVDFYAKGDD